MRPLVICCSQRFKSELDKFVPFLKDKGVLAYSPDFKRHKSDFIKKDEEKRLESGSYRAKVPGLVWSHFNNLEVVKSLCGVCLIFNPLSKGKQRKEYGYIGSNTQGEVAYTAALKLPLIMIRPHREKWIMAVAHENDRNRIFANSFPEADPLDYEFLWEKWLKYWLS